MTDRRALLTDREREIVAGEADVDDSYRYQTISRIRSRFDRLSGDLEALGKHGDLLEEFRSAVCGESAETGAEPVAVRRSSDPDPKGSTSENTPSAAWEYGPEVSESTLSLLADELAGSGDLLDRRIEAILEMHDVLRDCGEAEKDELLAVVDIDAVDYQSEASVWSNMVKGKDTLRALSGVEPPPTGKTVWRFKDE